MIKSELDIYAKYSKVILIILLKYLPPHLCQLCLNDTLSVSTLGKSLMSVVCTLSVGSTQYLTYFHLLVVFIQIDSLKDLERVIKSELDIYVNCV